MPARLPHCISLTLYFILLGFLTLTTFWPSPAVGVSVPLILAIKLIPLLLVLPGLLTRSKRSWIWLSFVVLVYFTAGVVQTHIHEWLWPHVLLTTLTVLLFISTLWTIRSRVPV